MLIVNFDNTTHNHHNEIGQTRKNQIWHKYGQHTIMHNDWSNQTFIVDKPFFFNNIIMLDEVVSKIHARLVKNNVTTG